jgi:hypothetical protein
MESADHRLKTVGQAGAVISSISYFVCSLVIGSGGRFARVRVSLSRCGARNRQKKGWQ